MKCINLENSKKLHSSRTGVYMWLNLLSLMIASGEVGVPISLLYSVCHTETRIRNVINHFDGGSKSYGMCQVKLGTARQFFPGITAAELMNPYKNALVAATYLKYQGKRFGSMFKGISAYNAGRPIKGNKKYVNKVLASMKEFHEISRNNCIIY